MSGWDSTPAPSDGEGGPTEAFGDEGPRYERQGLLGTGGMGRVYATQDTRLRRQVALKVAATPELAGRLAREAWITAQLEHPGIVAVYDAGETDGQAWYTMRLIRGRTLRERLAECDDLQDRLALLPHLHAACQAVAYAHSMGIVHRDLKPANIMVGEFRETQVADWGLARPVDEALADWQRIVAGGPHSGLAGTPRYMSPEQASGATTGFTSDVFCLGVVLYEMLAGRAPPEEPGRPPDLDALVDAPAELVAIARRSLELLPDDRYPSAIEQAADLDRWLNGRRVEAHEYRPSELFIRLVTAWRAPLAVASLALVVLAMVAANGARRTAEERAVADANLAGALAQQALVALDADRAPEARILAAHALTLRPSPVARGVLAASVPGGAERLWRKELPENCQHTAVVSPDARSLACFGQGRVEVWSVDPLELKWGLVFPLNDRPAWVGDRLLVEDLDGLHWVDDGTATPLGHAGWPLASGPDSAYAVIGGLEARRVTDRGVEEAFSICQGSRPTTLIVEDDLVVGCSDAVLRVYGREGTVEVPLSERPAWSAVAAAAGGLVVGRLEGSVEFISLPDGAHDTPLEGFRGSVTELDPLPETPLVLVRGERGGPRIWNVEVGAWVGSLPGGSTRMAAGAETGQVLLLGESLELWQLPASPRPSVLQFDAGLAQVVFSPDGSEVVAALGTGAVVRRRLSDGMEQARWRLSDGVTKCVAWVQSDTIFAAAMGAPPRLLRTSAASDVEYQSPIRRAGALANGRVWALTYSGHTLLMDGEGGQLLSMDAQEGFDGSSSPSRDTAAIIGSEGAVHVLGDAGWSRRTQVIDGVAVDVGDAGSPIVVARRHEVCVDLDCTPISEVIIDVAYADGRVAIGTLSGDVLVLDAETGETLATLRGHDARIASVEFSPDANLLVSGSWDNTARIWNLGSLDTPPDELLAEAERTWGISLEEALGAR